MQRSITIENIVKDPKDQVIGVDVAQMSVKTKCPYCEKFYIALTVGIALQKLGGHIYGLHELPNLKGHNNEKIYRTSKYEPPLEVTS